MKFKKEFAGEYKATGLYKGKEAIVEASVQMNGKFVWSSYLDGSYVAGDGPFPLKDIKWQLECSPSIFFE